MPWYVARSRPGKEVSSAASLEEAGLDPFYPKRKVRMVIRGKPQEQERALYPGYIFVEGELTAEAWHQACDGTDISGFLGAKGDKHWTIISAEIINEVRAELDGDLWTPKDEELPPAFERGQKLQVIDGPFAGMTALCEWVGPSGRVRIKGYLLKREVSLYLPAESLSAEIQNKPETPRKGPRRGKYGFPAGSGGYRFRPPPAS